MSEELERRYRRFLACYPPTYRREYESEMCGVLLSAARDGQRYPSLREGVALLRGAVAMRLAPAAPRPPRNVRMAVRLMIAAALAEIVVLIRVAATQGNLHDAILAHDPRYTAAQWHAERLHHIVPIEIGAPIAAGLWLWLAWGNGRGRNWARVGAALMLALTTVSLLTGLAQGAVTYAPTDAIAGGALWCVAVAAVLFAFSPASGSYYERRLA